MIHYLAELIKSAERQSAKNRPALLEKCFDTILALWQHRHELPDGKRPFEQLEPALRALESLDPSHLERRYYPSVWSPANGTKESKASQKWLELADGLDYSARVLIRQCLANASASAIDKSKEWVALAEQAARDDIELPILKIIIAERDVSDTSDPGDEQRKLLEDRVGKLRAFIKLATTLAVDYERKLKRAKPKAAGKSEKTTVASRLARPQRVIVETRGSRRKKATTARP